MKKFSSREPKWDCFKSVNPGYFGQKGGALSLKANEIPPILYQDAAIFPFFP